MPAPIRRIDELGFPIPGSFDDVPNSAERPKRTWGKFFYRYRWAVLLLIVPVIFGAAIVNGVRSYVADQLLVRAAMDYRREQFPAALAAADRALFWAPENSDRWEMFEIRADIRSKLPGQLHGCVDDLNDLIRLLEEPKLSRRFSDHLRDAYGMRGWVLERLGQHKQAIADSTIALKLSVDEQSRAQYLNSRAYIRALANRELPQALEDVNQSLNLQSSPLVVDTRAYVLFKLGKLDEAKKELDDSIDTMVHGDRDEAAGAADGPHVWTDEDEQRERQSEDYRESLAVMYHHRGEILKKLGQDAAADEDIRKADFFGYSPERGVY